MVCFKSMCIKSFIQICWSSGKKCYFVLIIAK
jgi:hypothetical protein